MNIPGVNKTTRLTNVEAQRMMAVLDEAVSKLGLNNHLSDYVLESLDKYQDSLSTEFATSLRALRECKHRLALDMVCFNGVLSVLFLCSTKKTRHQKYRGHCSRLSCFLRYCTDDALLLNFLLSTNHCLVGLILNKISSDTEFLQRYGSLALALANN